VAAMCRTSRRVPRLWCPGARKRSAAASAAASIRFTMTGVASTCTLPLPTCGAVCASATPRSAEPVRPTFSPSACAIEFSHRLCRAEPCRAPYAAGIAVPVTHEPSRDRIREYVRSPKARHAAVQPIDVGEPAAEHDDGRIEDVDHRRERAGEPLLVACE